jgi:hypothetical protein
LTYSNGALPLKILKNVIPRAQISESSSYYSTFEFLFPLLSNSGAKYNKEPPTILD